MIFNDTNDMEPRYIWLRSRGSVLARCIAAVSRRWRKPNSASERGALGEKLAAKQLRKLGYQVLLRNVCSRYGEIDLVCRHEQALVFVEVKTRDAAGSARAADAVNTSKQRRIMYTAYWYLAGLREKEVPVRFDVVEVYLLGDKMLRHNVIKGAFVAPRH